MDAVGGTARTEASDARRPVVSVGEIVAGKFRVERVIGEGGMGIVVEATHLQLEERVALKFLHHEALAAAEIVSRFKQEARAAVKLKSEHIARVIDVGTREDGAPFMVMEYLEGSDLSNVLAQRGALTIAVAAEYVIQTCEGVAEAHARGIVHRDIKPENLFLVRRNDGWQFVKVLDFGISKAALAGAPVGALAATSTMAAMQPEALPHIDLHRTTAALGSPLYMSPEQVRWAGSVDHRADIWSLGVTLFELLTAQMPFDDTKPFPEVARDILDAPHRRLLDYRPDAPPELGAVLDRCLAKDRNDRFQSTAELAVALLPFAPRRARVAAERAISVSRAAGMLSDPKITLPPSVFPPPMDGLPTSSLPPGQAGDRVSDFGRVGSGSYGALRVGGSTTGGSGHAGPIVSGSGGPASSRNLVGTGSSPNGLGIASGPVLVAASDPPVQRSSRGLVVALIGALVVAAGVLAYVFVLRPHAGATPTTAQAGTDPAASGAPSSTAADPSAAASSPSATTGAAASVAVIGRAAGVADPTPRGRRTGSGRAGGAASTPATAVSKAQTTATSDSGNHPAGGGSPDLDIRRER